MVSLLTLSSALTSENNNTAQMVRSLVTNIVELEPDCLMFRGYVCRGKWILWDLYRVNEKGGQFWFPYIDTYSDFYPALILQWTIEGWRTILGNVKHRAKIIVRAFNIANQQQVRCLCSLVWQFSSSRKTNTIKAILFQSDKRGHGTKWNNHQRSNLWYLVMVL